MERIFFGVIILTLYFSFRGLRRKWCQRTICSDCTVVTQFDVWVL